MNEFNNRKEPVILGQLLGGKKENLRMTENGQVDFIEGEAVVMYYQDISKANTLNVNLFGRDIEIKKSWDFWDEEKSDTFTENEEDTPKILRVSEVFSEKLTTSELISELKKQEIVIYAEPNYIYHATQENLSGKYTKYQWALKNLGQNNGMLGCDIKPEAVWESVTGTDKVIAIIDTGIDYTHMDLKDNIWNNPNLSTIKGEHGYDFVNNDTNPMDDNGHGTHCAGIIAGSNKGISGVNQQAKLMALKFLDANGSGKLANAVGAYDYINRCLKLGIPIVAINNSWGGNGRSAILDKLINLVGQNGAITVNAAGNEETNLDGNSTDVWSTKSDYRISVAASNERDELAAFSNYGEATVDLAAPGTNILSSVSYSAYNPTIHDNNEAYSELYINFNEAFPYSEIKTFKIPKTGSVKVSAVKGIYFGLYSEMESCLTIQVEAKEKGQYGIYVPITLPESSTNYYLSAAVKVKYQGEKGTTTDNAYIYFGIDKLSKLRNVNLQSLQNLMVCDYFKAYPKANYWSVKSMDANIRSASGYEDGVWLCVDAGEPGTYVIYLENVGFSKKDMKLTDLGKYEFYNGTSMAAPQVTGAVALLSVLHPELDAKELRSVLVNSVRKTEAMKNYTISGGVLDLSKAVVKTEKL